MKNKIKYLLLILILCLNFTVPVCAAEDTFVYDDADILTDSEEKKLNNKLGDLSDEHQAEIVVVTVDSMDGQDIVKYINNVYDSKKFGYGSERDGVLLLISMNPREFNILSNGYAGVAINTGDISDIQDVMEKDLSAGRYYNAVNKYADECDYYLTTYVTGVPFDFTKSLAFAIVGGLVIGLIVALVLKGQLKSIRRQTRANDYVKSGSMHVTHSKDIYLYRKVTSRPKETNRPSGSGSSSGRSVGSGRSF